jgi:hypothetical protein
VPVVFISSLLDGVRKLFQKSPIHIEWHVLCIIFDSIDVVYLDSGGRQRHFKYSLKREELDTALRSFRQFPALAKECSCGLANIDHRLAYADRPLTSLTSMGASGYWPSPADTAPELERFAPGYDSVFIFWPQNDAIRHRKIPTAGWGLAIGPGYIPGGGTYCSIANASLESWEVPRIGEVWLHEWLHGVCDFFESKGFPMPEHNADGGGSHGYIQSPVTGWCGYYRDLMTGQVEDHGRKTGITPAAWLSGTISR